MTDETNIKALRPKTEDIASVASRSKKQIEENPLLEALTLVIESNAEYARGVTTILDTDLEREVLLNDIKKELIAIKKTVDNNTIDISTFKQQLIEIIEKLEKIRTESSKQLEDKLSPLYVAANLQGDGKQYNPTDKLVVGFQKVVSSKVSMMLAGAAIWLLAKYVFKSFSGFN